MSSIYYAVFMRLSSLVKRLGRTPEFVRRTRDRKLKCRTTRFVRLDPHMSPMGIDDRSTNGQPYPHSVGLCCVESIENALSLFRINPRPRIAHGDESILLPLLGADQQLSWPIDRAHCFDRVQDQVQDHLLQLNTISLD